MSKTNRETDETVDQLLKRIKQSTAHITKQAKRSEAKPDDMFVFIVKKPDLDVVSAYEVLHEKCLDSRIDHYADFKYELRRDTSVTNAGAKCVACGAMKDEKLRKLQIKEAAERNTLRHESYQEYIKEQILLGNI